MWTILAFSVSHDPGGVYTNLTPVPDQTARVEGNGFIVPNFANKYVGAAAFVGALGAQARIVAPSIRNIGLEHIAPVTLAINPAAEHFHCINTNRYLDLAPNETLEVLENSNPAAAEQHAAIIFLSDSEIVPVKGKIRTIRFNLNSAMVVNTWVYNVITLIEDLPVGSYDIVGMRIEAAGAIAARIVMPGAVHRPGIITSETAGVNSSNQFRYGNMGVLSTFINTQLPGIELLGSAAAAAADYVGYMDIISK